MSAVPQIQAQVDYVAILKAHESLYQKFFEFTDAREESLQQDIENLSAAHFDVPKPSCFQWVFSRLHPFFRDTPPPSEIHLKLMQALSQALPKSQLHLATEREITVLDKKLESLLPSEKMRQWQLELKE